MLQILLTRPQRPFVDSKQCVRMLHQTAEQLFISSSHASGGEIVNAYHMGLAVWICPIWNLANPVF